MPSFKTQSQKNEKVVEKHVPGATELYTCRATHCAKVYNESMDKITKLMRKAEPLFKRKSKAINDHFAKYDKLIKKAGNDTKLVEKLQKEKKDMFEKIIKTEFKDLKQMGKKIDAATNQIEKCITKYCNKKYKTFKKNHATVVNDKKKRKALFQDVMKANKGLGLSSGSKTKKSSKTKKTTKKSQKGGAFWGGKKHMNKNKTCKSLNSLKFTQNMINTGNVNTTKLIDNKIKYEQEASKECPDEYRQYRDQTGKGRNNNRFGFDNGQNKVTVNNGEDIHLKKYM